MIIESILLSLITAYILGGSLKNIDKVEIKYGFIFFTLIVLESLSIVLVTRFDNTISSLLYYYFNIIHLIIYFLFIFCIFLNRKIRGFKLIFMGSLLNFIAMLFNHGPMPVYYEALIKAGIKDQLNLLLNNNILTHSLSFTSSGVYFLGDIIAIGPPYPFPKVISIGDLIFALGIFIFFHYYMNSFNILKNKLKR